MKDWTGSKQSPMKIIGASNHAEGERQKNDYYATDPNCVKDLLEHVLLSGYIWEPACGEGHISKALEEAGNDVVSTDLHDYGYGEVDADFLKCLNMPFPASDIVTNPPYKYAMEFAEKALELVDDKRKVCFFLKLTFLEGQKRREFFEKYPPQRVLVYSRRQNCALNGDFSKSNGSAVCYAWFIWVKGFKGQPTIEWI